MEKTKLSTPDMLIGATLAAFWALSVSHHSADHLLIQPDLWMTSSGLLTWSLWLWIVSRFGPSVSRPFCIVRALAPEAGLAFSYGLVKYLTPVLHPDLRLQDRLFQEMDSALFGRSFPWFYGRLQNHPGWVDLMCLAYLSLFLWLAGFLLYQAFFRLETFNRFMTGFILLYVVGLTGNLAWPALGPQFHQPSHWDQISGGFAWKVFVLVNRDLGSRFDLFPSLHAGISMYFFAYHLRWDKKGMVWGMAWMLVLWLSALTLGVHYLIDLVAGGFLGMFCVWAGPLVEEAGIFSFDLHKKKVFAEGTA